MIPILAPLALFVLLVARVPVAFALAVVGGVSLLASAGPQLALGIVSEVFFETTASYVFLIVPMFVLMGEFLAVSGIAREIVECCQKWLGHLVGGVGYACVAASTVMAAVIGSSTASTAVMSSAAYGPMRSLGYAPGFAVGIIAISGTLAVMIPPSIILIIYGILTNESIGKLLIAGVLPGLLTAFGYVLAIRVMIKLRPSLAPRVEPFNLGAATRGLGKVWPATLLVVIMIGSLYSGLASPTEIGALGALVALLISVSLGRMPRAAFSKAVRNAASVTANLMLILIGALIFGYFVTESQLSQKALRLISESGLGRWEIMFIIILIYLILGCFMDQIAILVLTTPLIYPIIKSLGFDGVWFGIIMTKTAEIGFVTPPFGMNVFLASNITKVKMSECFRGVAPFILVELLLVAILLAFPAISLYLPSLM